MGCPEASAVFERFLKKQLQQGSFFFGEGCGPSKGCRAPMPSTAARRSATLAPATCTSTVSVGMARSSRPLARLPVIQGLCLLLDSPTMSGTWLD